MKCWKQLVGTIFVAGHFDQGVKDSCKHPKEFFLMHPCICLSSIYRCERKSKEIKFTRKGKIRGENVKLFRLGNNANLGCQYQCHATRLLLKPFLYWENNLFFALVLSAMGIEVNGVIYLIIEEKFGDDPWRSWVEKT